MLDGACTDGSEGGQLSAGDMMHTIKARAKGEPPTGWWLSFVAVFCLIQAQPGLLGQNWGVVTLLANLLCAASLLLRGEGRTVLAGFEGARQRLPARSRRVGVYWLTSDGRAGWQAV